MARQHHTPEEIVAKLRQVEVLLAQGKPAVEAARVIGVPEQTYCRWRSEYGGLKLDQVKRLTTSTNPCFVACYRGRRRAAGARPTASFLRAPSRNPPPDTELHPKT